MVEREAGVYVDGERIGQLGSCDEELAKTLKSRLEARSKEELGKAFPSRLTPREQPEEEKPGGLVDAPEVEMVGKELIKNEHDHEHLANAKIKYAFKDKDKWESKGKTVWGKAFKLSPREKFLSGYDLMVVINKKLWDSIENKTRRALVDHEFCHFLMDDANDTWKTVPHDVEDFIAVVRRHGAWTQELERMIEVGSKQLNLFEEAS